MENNLVDELVTNLIQNKTINPTEKNSVSTILSGAINSLPASQLPIFKKRIEILAESSNQSIFTESGINIGAFQSVINNIVKDVEKNPTLESKNTSSLTQNTSDLDDLFNSNNDITLEDDPLDIETSPEYIELYNSNMDFLDTYIDDENFEISIDDLIDSGILPEDFEFQNEPVQDEPVQNKPKLKRTLKIEPEQVKEQKERFNHAMIKMERFTKKFEMYIQRGLSNEEALSLTLEEMKMTEKDLKKDGAFHEAFIANFFKNVNDFSKKENVSNNQVFELHPELHPENNYLFKKFATQEEKKSLIDNHADFGKTLRILFTRFIFNPRRCTLELSNSQEELKILETELQEYIKYRDHNTFSPDEYAELLNNYKKTEKNLAIANRNYIFSKDPSAPISNIIQTATMDYFLSNKSVTEIYYDYKTKYPDEIITFDDILDNVVQTSQTVLNSEKSKLIKSNELEIYKTDSFKKGYDLAKSKNSINEKTYTTMQLKFKDVIYNRNLSSSNQKEIFRNFLGLKPQEINDNLTPEQKQYNTINNLFLKVTEFQTQGLSEGDSISKALTELNISKEDLEKNGKYHDSLITYFNQKVQTLVQEKGGFSKKILNKLPMLHPNQNVLMKNFLTTEEKLTFFDDKTFRKDFNSYTPDQPETSNPSKIMANRNMNSYAEPTITEEKTSPEPAQNSVKDTTTPVPAAPDFETLIEQHDLNTDDLKVQNDLLMEALRDTEKQPVAVRGYSEVVNEQDKDQGPEI